MQIALNRFGGVTYDESTGIASIGAGNIWDNVYEALEPYSVNVVGGRVSGVGIAGFILGGGALARAVLCSVCDGMAQDIRSRRISTVSPLTPCRDSNWCYLTVLSLTSRSPRILTCSGR